MNKFLQFELWKDCNNKCAFCFNNNSATSVQRKIDRIKFVLNELKNKKYEDIERIGFIGGEFFDGQLATEELQNLFIELLNTALDRANVKQVLITTSFLFTDFTSLETTLRGLHDTSKLMICTSWDTKYRFKQEWSELLWEKNLTWVQKHFRDIKIHVEVLPTQFHIESVLAGKFNILDFENKYNVRVDYTDLNSGFNCKDKYEFQEKVPGFFPKRSDFLKFLVKVYTEGQATPDKFLNFANMSTLLWMECDGEYHLFIGYRGPVDGVTVNRAYPLPPMHENTSDYIDSHVRMRKDVLDMWETVNG